MVQSLKHLRHIMMWQMKGKPAPPPQIVKQRTIRQYQKRCGSEGLIETGTYLGDMVHAARPAFRKVYSIELSEELAKNAKNRFASDPGVVICQGDSKTELPGILKDLEEPAVFWLDGHFSGGVTALGNEVYPVLTELELIGGHSIKNHLLLIDDARLFVGDAGSPSKESIFSAIKKINPEYALEERDDIIRATIGC